MYRQLLTVSLLVMATHASAQPYTQPGQPQPAPQQFSDNYYAPHPAYQQPPSVPQAAPVPPQAPQVYYIEQPADYGHSVMTDLRQMNF